MTARVAVSWLGAATLLGALVLLPAGALAVPFTLTGLIEPCNPGPPSSCFFLLGQTQTWPDPTTFDMPMDPPAGGSIAFEITNFEIPTMELSQVFHLEFLIQSNPQGDLRLSDGVLELSFDMTIRRQESGQESSLFTYSMTTETDSDFCPSTPLVSLTGSNYNAVTHEVSIVGVQCVDISPTSSPDYRLVLMSLTGRIPEPSTLLLLGTGLTALAYVRRRRG
jgi:hypothetical protein